MVATVNPTASAYGGSNPPAPTLFLFQSLPIFLFPESSIRDFPNYANFTHSMGANQSKVVCFLASLFRIHYFFHETNETVETPRGSAVSGWL